MLEQVIFFWIKAIIFFNRTTFSYGCHFVCQIFKNLFEDALEIQKERLHELKVYAKDKRAEQKRQHQDELESMENYYKDQVGFFLPLTKTFL